MAQRSAGSVIPLEGLSPFPEGPRVVHAPGHEELAAWLPEGGYPRGVVELAGPRRLGGATQLALWALRALHEADTEVQAAWIDPGGSLYAPGVLAAGVDLARLLVVRPPWERFTEVAIKVAASAAFPLVVIDADPLGEHNGRRPLGARGDLFVRKLQLAAEAAEATIFLLTDLHSGRAGLPVTVRLELERRKHAIAVKVGKDRTGRVGQRLLVPVGEHREA